MSQVIPEAAVEAAFVALDAMRSYPNTLMDYLSSEKVARAALEAAAPYMLARGWDEGHQAGVREEQPGWTKNPYGAAQ